MARLLDLSDLVPQHLSTPRLTLELFTSRPEQYAHILAVINTPTAHAGLGSRRTTSAAQWDLLCARSRLRAPPFGPEGTTGSLLYIVRLGDEGGEMIGVVSCSQRVGGGGKLFPVDAGWAMLEPFMGKGFATEAAGELLRFLRGFGVREVVVYFSPTNARSNRVAEKLGFVPGGWVRKLDEEGKYHSLLILPGMERIEFEEGLDFGAVKQEF